MVRGCSKAYAFPNSKLIKLITLNYNHYTKAWLRLMYLRNLEEHQGFLVQFFAVFDPECSHMLHSNSYGIEYLTSYMANIYQQYFETNSQQK